MTDWNRPLTPGPVKIEPQREVAITLPLTWVEALLECAEVLSGSDMLRFEEQEIVTAIRREIEQVKRGGEGK